jgi:hypothetical protein
MPAPARGRPENRKDLQKMNARSPGRLLGQVRKLLAKDPAATTSQAQAAKAPS